MAIYLLPIIIFILIVLYVIKTILIKKWKQIASFLKSIWRSVKGAITENKEAQEFAKRHKKFFKFIKRRLNKDDFFGLPLTLLSVALLYILLLFGGIVEDIITSDIIVATDIRIANLLAVFRNAQITKIFIWITLLGKWEIILIFGAAAIFILWILKKRAYIIPFIISISGSEFFTYIGKWLFHRPRPIVAIYPESSFSFPSGHATIAIAFYGFLIYVLIRENKKWKNKINIFFLGLVTVLLIGFSRLYLDVHYMSDVWGGYLVGAIWLIISMSVSEYCLSKKQKEDKIPGAKKRIQITAIVIPAIIMYTAFAFYYQMPASESPEKTFKITNNITEIFNTEQIKYTETLSGGKQEPISFIVVAKNDQQFVDLFKRAGWALADNANIYSMTKLAKTAFQKKPYSTAPMTPDFWNTEVHNFGFEKSTNSNNSRSRHHARFWKTNYTTKDENNIYVGTASFDSSIKWGVTHKINPDIDTEREFLFKNLEATKMIASFQKQQFVNPKLGNNFSGDPFFTDGKLYLLFIKN